MRDFFFESMMIDFFIDILSDKEIFTFRHFCLVIYRELNLNYTKQYIK